MTVLSTIRGGGGFGYVPTALPQTEAFQQTPADYNRSLIEISVTPGLGNQTMLNISGSGYLMLMAIKFTNSLVTDVSTIQTIIDGRPAINTVLNDIQNNNGRGIVGSYNYDVAGDQDLIMEVEWIRFESSLVVNWDYINNGNGSDGLFAYQVRLT